MTGPSIFNRIREAIGFRPALTFGQRVEWVVSFLLMGAFFAMCWR